MTEENKWISAEFASIDLADRAASVIRKNLDKIGIITIDSKKDIRRGIEPDKIFEPGSVSARDEYGALAVYTPVNYQTKAPDIEPHYSLESIVTVYSGKEEPGEIVKQLYNLGGLSVHIN